LVLELKEFYAGHLIQHQKHLPFKIKKQIKNHFWKLCPF